MSKKARSLIEKAAGGGKVSKKDYQNLLDAGLSSQKIQNMVGKMDGYSFKNDVIPQQQTAIYDLNQATSNAANINSDLLKISNSPVQYTTQRVDNPKFSKNDRTPFEPETIDQSVVDYNYYTNNPEYMKYFSGGTFDSQNDIINTNMAIRAADTANTNRNLGMLQINNTPYTAPAPAPAPAPAAAPVPQAPAPTPYDPMQGMMDTMRGFMGDFTGGFTEAMQSMQQQPFYNQPLMVGGYTGSFAPNGMLQSRPSRLGYGGTSSLNRDTQNSPAPTTLSINNSLNI